MYALTAATTFILALTAAAQPAALQKRAGVFTEVQATEQTVNKGVMIGCLDSMSKTQWAGSAYQCPGGNFMMKMSNTNSNYQSPSDCWNTCAPAIKDKINTEDAVAVTCEHYANSVVGPAQSECWLDIWVQGNPEPHVGGS